ncbi:MAG TPA: pyruvate carboxylase subunit B, partial [Opitutaceae bacterium]|nr:pyruvate carboxylase subunit B [Opitutaceae bacterium]
NPGLFEFKYRRDRATKLLAFLGDLVVNGNPQLKGRRPARIPPAPAAPAFPADLAPAPGSRDLLRKLGPAKFAQWVRKQKPLLVTDTTMRDAHQSLMAARIRTHDMLRAADAVARRTPGLFSLECWGGATFDTSMRFLREDPYERLAALRARVPNICFQMLLRGANAVGYSFYPDNVVRGFVRHAAEAGVDIFRIFDSLNYLPNLYVALDAVLETGAVAEAAVCYTGDLLDPSRDKYTLRYYVKMARELEKRGAHILAIKDMAGLCRPYAAAQLVKVLREETALPIHFHTHDTSGIASASVLAAVDAGVDVVDLALASMSGSTSQPNLNSVVAALQHTPRETGLDLGALNEFSAYWEGVRELYAPFDSSPRAGTAEVYEHEMPGGQYTNLREQAASMGLGARWPEVVRTYAEVNLLFGDIVKVTPSSKVVGDMALFLVSRGIKPADVVNLEPGTTPFPASVVDMLAGELGQPPGGWPRRLQKVVLGDRKPRRGRPGANLPPVDLAKEKDTLARRLKAEVSDAALYCHLMYPDVFADFAKFQATYGDVSPVPSRAFFYGLALGEEISVDIEEGKTLFIKLINVSEPDRDGVRTLTFELNGRPRETRIADKSVAVAVKSRPKADPADVLQVAAPIPGLVTAITASVGAKVAKGDKLLTLEAMKMQTTLYASAAGVVKELLVAVGDTVESKDLLIRLQS